MEGAVSTCNSSCNDRKLEVFLSLSKQMETRTLLQKPHSFSPNLSPKYSLSQLPSVEHPTKRWSHLPPVWPPKIPRRGPPRHLTTTPIRSISTCWLLYTVHHLKATAPPQLHATRKGQDPRWFRLPPRGTLGSTARPNKPGNSFRICNNMSLQQGMSPDFRHLYPSDWHSRHT